MVNYPQYGEPLGAKGKLALQLCHTSFPMGIKTPVAIRFI